MDTPPPKVPLDQNELEVHLDEQLEFLERSCDAFDAGYTSEAKRIAVVLRVLLHQTTSSHALLAQLGKLNGYFVDTAFPLDPDSLISHSGLVSHKVGKGHSKYVPLLDRPFEWMPFPKWWSTVVFKDDAGSTLTRRDLVLIAANQDGGAHVDPALNAAYAALAKNNSLGWVTSDGVSEQPMTGAEKAAIRQIGHEVLKTFVKGYAKELPKDEGDAPVYFAGVTIRTGNFDPSALKPKQPVIFYTPKGK